MHLLFGLFFAVAAWMVLREPRGTWWWAAVVVGLWIGSVLIHELAHCVAAVRHGGSPHEIVLWPLGGLVQLSVPRSPPAEFAVALAGPLANALLAAVGLVVLYSQSVPSDAVATSPSWWLDFFVRPPLETSTLTVLGLVRVATWINFALASLNLLPAAPLDGARAARALLWSFVGYRRAARYTRAIALPTAAAVCLGPALLRAGGVTVDSLIELPLVGLGILLFLTAQSQPSRRPRHADDDLHEPDEWRVLGPPLLGADQCAGDETPLGPAVIGQAVEARPEEKLHRRQQQEEEEDRRMDEILSRLYVAGPDALSPEDQDLLKRVSARYRGRKSK